MYVNRLSIISASITLMSFAFTITQGIECVIQRMEDLFTLKIFRGTPKGIILAFFTSSSRKREITRLLSHHDLILNPLIYIVITVRWISISLIYLNARWNNPYFFISTSRATNLFCLSLRDATNYIMCENLRTSIFSIAFTSMHHRVIWLLSSNIQSRSARSLL